MTVSILFASAVIKLKHIPNTYFTVLPIQTKEWPFWKKSKNINCSTLEFSDAVVTKVMPFGDYTLILLIPSYILKDLMTRF